MYTGAQHQHVMRGVALVREKLGPDSVSVAILSAGYGLIDESHLVAPYEVTFSTMRKHQLDAWATEIKIREAFEARTGGFDLIFVLLGDNYLRAVQLPVETRTDQTLIFLASIAASKRLPPLAAKTHVVTLSNNDARSFRCGLVGLKGLLLQKIMERSAVDPKTFAQLYMQPEAFMRLVLPESPAPIAQPLFPDLVSRIPAKKAAKRTPALTSESEYPVPSVAPAPNTGFRMEYFIPDADDRVDPNFDFAQDVHTPERDPYLDDRYAHELFDQPNYDGILLSRTHLDSSRPKRQRIQALGGVHHFVRFRGPIMGDCGAFSYVDEDTPPYTTDDILNYYESLGFDYGVSIDHLIVGPYARPGKREQRFEMTLKNAAEFLNRYRSAGNHSFHPVGVIQGWDPESYAKMASAVIQMGYDYIAIGSLARSPTEEIIEVLDAIRPHLDSQTRVHLFGVARPSALKAFRHLGVTSFDSASPLRRAWLSADANYHTLSGRMYAAIRIPSVSGRSRRAQRVLDDGVVTEGELAELETAALATLRAYDTGAVGLQKTLEAVLDYDQLVERPVAGVSAEDAQRKRRAKHERKYRELLEDRPWRDCPCPICRHHGIEVVIFRGNNRNRRRGFHNTFVFYRRFVQTVGLSSRDTPETSQSQPPTPHRLANEVC